MPINLFKAGIKDWTGSLILLNVSFHLVEEQSEGRGEERYGGEGE